MWPQPDLHLDVIIGFNGMFKPGNWTPIILALKNRGAAIHGVIDVEVDMPTSQHRHAIGVTHWRVLELPKNSNKRFSFVVFLKSFSTPLSVKISEAGRQVLVQDIDLRSHAVSEKLVLGLSREVSLDFLSLLRRDRRQSSARNRIRVIYPHAEYLPNKWNGYASIDLIVIHNVNLKAMTNDQIDAIDKWVSTGGTLVVSGGVHTSQAGILQPLMPVKIIGRTELTSLSSLGTRFNSNLQTEKKFSVSAATPTEGSVLVEEQGLPVLVKGERGDGAVFFMAFDFAKYPIHGWSGKYDMWRFIMRKILARDNAGAAQAEDPLTASLANQIMSTPLFSLPSHTSLLAVILAYLGCLLIAIRFFGHGPASLRQSGEPAILGQTLKNSWAIKGLSMAALAFVFSFAVDYIFNTLLSRAEMSLIDVTHLTTSLGQKYGELKKDIVLAATRKTYHSLDVGGRDFSVSHAGPGSITVESTPSLQISDILINRWSTRFLRVQTIVQFPVEGLVRKVGSSVKLRLENKSAWSVSDGFLVFRGQPYFVGKLEPDAEISETFRYGAGLYATPSEFETTDLLGEDAKNARIKNAILKYFFASEDWKLENTIVFAGWIDEPLLSVGTGKTFFSDLRVNLLTIAMPFEENSYGI